MQKFGTLGEFMFEGGNLTPVEQIQIHPVSLKDFSFTPQDGFLYVATRAISSRVNANLDSWPVDELRKSYKSFIGRGVFVEHQNWDPSRSRGVILDAIYRESKTASGIPDAAVYLLLEVDAQQYPKLANAVLTNKITGVSMGADVSHTVCSSCGNSATDPSGYCEHIPGMKGLIVSSIKNGRKIEGLVHEICYGHNFFEISFVFDPADESAWISDKRLYSSNAKTGRVLSKTQWKGIPKREGLRKVASKIDTFEYPLELAYPSRYAGSDVVLRVPQDVDTLQGEDICPSCNEDFDGLICDNCGFEQPPEDLANPDLTPDDRQETVNEDQQEVQQQQQWSDQLDQQDPMNPEEDIQDPTNPNDQQIQDQLQSGPDVGGQEVATGYGQENPNEAEQIPLTGDHDQAGEQYAEEEMQNGLQGYDEYPEEDSQERQRDMSRFQDLLAQSSKRAMVPDSKYDQTSTMFLDSMGMDEDAPSPVSDLGGSQQGKSRKELDVTDLNAAGSDIQGGPGTPAVRANRNRRPMTLASKRVALRRIAEDINELQGQAGQDVGAVQDQMPGIQEAPTDQGLGDVDTLLQTLSDTVEQLDVAVGQGQAVQEAPMDPGAPAPMANAPATPAPEQEAEQLPNVSTASIKRDIRRARFIVRKARRVLADFGPQDEEVTQLVGELDEEVNNLDQDVDQLDQGQHDDNLNDPQFQDEPFMAKKVKRVSAKKKLSMVQSHSRVARRHLKAALTIMADDFGSDREVDQQIDQTVDETDQIVHTLEEIEGEQKQDEMSAFASRGNRVQRRSATQNARKISALTKRAKVIQKKTHLLQSKFVQAGDFDEMDDLGGSVDHDLIELEHDVADLEGDQSFDNGGSDFGPPSESSGSDMDTFSPEPDTFQTPGNNGGDGSNPPLDFDGDEEGRGGNFMANRRTSPMKARVQARPVRRQVRRPLNTTVATNGNQETQRWTDATNLDDMPATREQAEKPSFRTDVTTPVDEGNQLRAADVPPFYNDGASAGYTFDNPPSKAQWPDDPGGYEYKKQERESSRTRLLASIQLVESMEEMGMVKKADRARHVAEYERMSAQKLEGVREMLEKMKSSNLRTPRRVATSAKAPSEALKRVPELGRLKTATVQPTVQDILADDSVAFL